MNKLRKHANACEAEIRRLNAELERERMRLAACGVVALADTPESAAQAREMCDEYRSASCDDVARRVDECMTLRAERDALFSKLSQTTFAVRDVLTERRRQVEAEGWTPEHDDKHTNDELAALACFYAMPASVCEWSSPDCYGDTLGEFIRSAGWWQTTTGDRRRELVRAGALILAEIERLDRAEAAKTQPQPSGD